MGRGCQRRAPGTKPQGTGRNGAEQQHTGGERLLLAGWRPARMRSRIRSGHGEQLASIGSAPVLGVASANHFGKGFFDQSAEVWSKGGELLATTHQVVYFKE